jgi:hypothetical protein
MTDFRDFARSSAMALTRAVYDQWQEALQTVRVQLSGRALQQRDGMLHNHVHTEAQQESSYYVAGGALNHGYQRYKRQKETCSCGFLLLFCEEHSISQSCAEEDGLPVGKVARQNHGGLHFPSKSMYKYVEGLDLFFGEHLDFDNLHVHGASIIAKVSSAALMNSSLNTLFECCTLQGTSHKDNNEIAEILVGYFTRVYGKDFGKKVFAAGLKEEKAKHDAATRTKLKVLAQVNRSRSS